MGGESSVQESCFSVVVCRLITVSKAFKDVADG